MEVPGRRVARVVVALGEYPCGQLWGWQGDAVEGEFERRVGVRERHDELDVGLVQTNGF